MDSLCDSSKDGTNFTVELRRVNRSLSAYASLLLAVQYSSRPKAGAGKYVRATRTVGRFSLPMIYLLDPTMASVDALSADPPVATSALD